MLWFGIGVAWSFASAYSLDQALTQSPIHTAFYLSMALLYALVSIGAFILGASVRADR